MLVTPKLLIEPVGEPDKFPEDPPDSPLVVPVCNGLTPMLRAHRFRMHKTQWASVLPPLPQPAPPSPPPLSPPAPPPPLVSPPVMHIRYALVTLPHLRPALYLVPAQLIVSVTCTWHASLV